MIIKKNVIYARNEAGVLEPLENLLVGQQDTISADKVTDLAMVAKTGRYEHLIGAPDPNDLIIDAGIEVGDVEPERTSIDVWIDTNENQTTYKIPEIKDNVVNTTDTWSSNKIDNFVRSSGAGIYMHAEAPEDESINLWLDTELSDGDSIRVPEINDEIVSLDDTWSSSKIQSEIALNASGLQDFSTLINLIYPVGSIYTSANPTHPSTLFGGTWVQIKGRFLLTADDETYFAGDKDGEAEHKLTLEEMPNYEKPIMAGGTGSYLGITWSKTFASSTSNYLMYISDEQPGGGNVVTTEHTEGDHPHNNMPPYLVVYAWQRTE